MEIQAFGLTAAICLVVLPGAIQRTAEAQGHPCLPEQGRLTFDQFYVCCFALNFQRSTAGATDAIAADIFATFAATVTKETSK